MHVVRAIERAGHQSVSKSRMSINSSKLLIRSCSAISSPRPDTNWPLLRNNNSVLTKNIQISSLRQPFQERTTTTSSFHTMTNKTSLTNRHLYNDNSKLTNGVIKNVLLTKCNSAVIPRNHRNANQTIHTLESSPKFRTMAGVQKMATEPSREHIDNIRQVLRNMKAKDANNQEIILDKDHTTGIATVCIKSAAKNGISGKMMSDFLDVIDDLSNWNEGKGVIIYGHNGFFCSGGDLVSVREIANYEDGLKMSTLMQYNLTQLQSLPMVTMALIQGKALGGGAEIAVTADLRLMTKSARIGYVHRRVGIVAAWGGGSRLVQLVGPSRALDMMSSARLVEPGEALNMGLVNSLLDDSNMTNDQVMDAAKSYLLSHIFGAKSTIIAMKGLVNAARTMPLEQALVAEGQILTSTWGKKAHMDALNSNIKHD